MRSRLKIYNNNLQRISMEAIGLYGLKLHVPSPSYRADSEVLDNGRRLIVAKILEERNLSAEFYFKARSYKDSILLRDQLYEILNNEIYIEDINIPGKLWRCLVDGWSPDRITIRTQKMTVPLVCVEGYAQSINVKKETFTANRFNFNNQGNVKIDMRTQTDTSITFRGQSSNLTIRNKTTGDTWSYNGMTTVNDEIKLIGVQSLKNDASIFANTNKKLIDIEVGNNEFEISGVNGEFELTISTRFYFL